MKISCDVILDLIPLVKDGVSSDDSKKLVLEHIGECTQCQEAYNTLSNLNNEGERSLQDEKVIKGIKRSLFIGAFMVLIVGSIIGVALSYSFGMFYNFIIMPLMGVLGYLLLKKKCYLVSIGIFILGYIGVFMKELAESGFYKEIFISALMLALIYAVLSVIGIAIGALFKFAITGEGITNERK